jgi:uncharacterized membrane protein
MFDIPLHPIVVHFPIVLAILLPIVALTALGIGYRQDKGRKFWVGVVLLNILLVGSSFVAVQTGEKDEEKVEEVLISEAPLESHAEKAELFLKITAAVLFVTALGLVPGAMGLYARGIGSLASLVLVFLVIQVGHSGGQLVYKHGATAAFVANSSVKGGPGSALQFKAGNKDEGENGAGGNGTTETQGTEGVEKDADD